MASKVQHVCPDGVSILKCLGTLAKIHMALAELLATITNRLDWCISVVKTPRDV